MTQGRGRRPPKIVRGTTREIEKLPPPMTISHKYVSGPIGGAGMTGEKVDLYISENSLQKMIEHCVAFAEQKLEVMGLLIGDRYLWEGELYTVVQDVVSTDMDSTLVSVRFQREGFENLFENLADIEYDYILVGWYHSHPGHTCFMSGTDIDTQVRMFSEPYHVAIVIDPINQDMKVFSIMDRRYVIEKPFAVCQERVKLLKKVMRVQKFQKVQRLKRVKKPKRRWGKRINE